MNAEDFRNRFRMEEALTGPPVISHRATDTDGSSVMVHFMVGAQGVDPYSFLMMLPKLQPSDSRQILDLLEVDGVPTLVTAALEEFSSLPDWLQASAGKGPESEEKTEAKAPPPPAPGPTAVPPEIAPPLPPDRQADTASAAGDKPPGAYTMLFGVPSTSGKTAGPQPAGPEAKAESPEPQPAGPEPQPAGPKPRAATPEPASSPPEEPAVRFPGGDATPSASDSQPAAPVFPGVPGQAPKSAGPQGPVAKPPSPPPAPPKPPSQPPPPAAPLGDAPPTPPPEKQAPGPYTMTFGKRSEPQGAPPPRKPADHQWPPRPPAPPPTRPSPVGDPGYAPPQRTPPPAPPAGEEGAGPGWPRYKDSPAASGGHIPSDDYLERLSGHPAPPSRAATPSAIPPTPPPGPTPPPPPPGGGPAADAPSPYTMIRQGVRPPGSAPPAPAAQPKPQRPPPPPQTADQPRKKPSATMIFALIVVLLAIVGLVVAFALLA